jgi:Domain of unknown function (DUF932)
MQLELLDTASFATEGARPIWSDLATVVDSKITNPVEALILAGAAWKVYKTPLHSWIVDINTKERVEFTSTRKYAIHREDTNDYLGDVGEGFTIVQNHEAFQNFQPYLEDGSAYIESAGMFSRGKIVWLICRLKESSEISLPDGDKLEQRVLLTLCHNTERSAETILINSLQSTGCILSSASHRNLRFMKVRQTKTVNARLAKIQKDLNIAKQALQTDAQLYELLMQVKLHYFDLEKFFESLFEVKLTKLTKEGEPKWTLDNIPEIKWIKLRLVNPESCTAWELYKAICAYVTFDTLENRRPRSSTQTKLELQVRSLWFVKDDDIRTRALILLKAMITH